MLAFALVLNTGAAAALAMCQHQDAQVHAAALQSDDSRIASSARVEEIAGRSAAKAGAMADQPHVPVGAFMIPAGADAPFGLERASALFVPRAVLEPPSRRVAPPERPPHA